MPNIGSQILPIVNGTGTVGSSSYAATAGHATTADTATNATSASYAVSASYADNGLVSGQDATFGKVTADTITANEMIIHETTRSILYASGSTKFGDTDDDTHQFTGSVDVDGAITVSDTTNTTFRNIIHNKSTGSAAAAGFTATNDAGHTTTVGIGGSNSTLFPETAVFYGPGYGDNKYACDGDKSHKWLGDPTDSHTFLSLNRVNMELDAHGNLTVSKSLSVGGDVTVSGSLIAPNIYENGFVNTAHTSLSFDNSTRELTVNKISDYSYWAHGEQHYKTADESTIIDDIHGLHFVYFNDVITSSAVWSDTFITTYALAAIVYWDKANQKQIMLGDERHGCLMSPDTHKWAHNTFGARLQSGGGLGNIDADGDGDNNISAVLSNDATIVWDEDLKHSHSDRISSSIMPVYYMTGSTADPKWNIDETNMFPVITGSSDRAVYNQSTGGEWVKTDITNNDFVLAHILATNDVDRPYISLMGQNDYLTANAARNGAEAEINSLILAGLPSPELVFLGTVIYQTSDGYDNEVQSRIRSTGDGDDYIDLRDASITRGGISSTVNEHNSLAGLQGGASTEYYHLTATEQSTLILDADTGSMTVGTASYALQSNIGQERNAQTGTTYTLVDADHGKLVTMDNASAITVDIDTGMRDDFGCVVLQKGAGQVHYAGTATQLELNNYTASAGQGAGVSIQSIGSDTYWLSGRMI